jgi:DNA-binding MarR family transcriptional regulator
MTRSTDARTANLLGALATTLAGHAGALVDDRAELAGSDAAALVTLDNYAEGQPLDLLRGALGLSHAATVRLADRLAARGLLERRRSEQDRRAVGLWLTEAGRAAARDARAARAAAIAPALAALEPAERRALAGLASKMLAAQTTDAEASRWICRLCDPVACGHPRGCPVTRAAMALPGAGRPA